MLMLLTLSYEVDLVLPMSELSAMLSAGSLYLQRNSNTIGTPIKQEVPGRLYQHCSVSHGLRSMGYWDGAMMWAHAFP
jgi:hypothetical protein